MEMHPRKQTFPHNPLTPSLWNEEDFCCHCTKEYQIKETLKEMGEEIRLVDDNRGQGF